VSASLEGRQNPVLNLLFTPSKHGRYFQEIGRRLASGESVGPPAPDEIRHLLKTAQHDYWVAIPEQNALVGITLLQVRRLLTGEVVDRPEVGQPSRLD